MSDQELNRVQMANGLEPIDLEVGESGPSVVPFSSRARPEAWLTCRCPSIVSAGSSYLSPSAATAPSTGSGMTMRRSGRGRARRDVSCNIAVTSSRPWSPADASLAQRVLFGRWPPGAGVDPEREQAVIEDWTLIFVSAPLGELPCAKIPGLPLPVMTDLSLYGCAGPARRRKQLCRGR